MTNIIIRYDPQLIFDPKISSGNGDLKLIMNGASFESDPQIHLRILYILYNIVEIKPSTLETSEIIIDFLMNIYNFRYVLTMDDEYNFPIQPLPTNLTVHGVSVNKGSLLSGQKPPRDEQMEEASLQSKSIPFNMSDRNLDKISKQKSSSSLNKETNEEEESKFNSEEYKDANLFYFGC